MDENKSIGQLQSGDRNNAGSFSGIPTRCQPLMQVAVKDLSKEQIRFLLSQDIGTIFLLDKTLQILEGDILADGDFYPGDLLSALVNIDRSYWQSKPELAVRLHLLLTEKCSLIQKAGHKKLFRDVEQFIAGQFATAH